MHSFLVISLFVPVCGKIIDEIGGKICKIFSLIGEDKTVSTVW
jgi:hypothetical protein